MPLLEKTFVCPSFQRLGPHEALQSLLFTAVQRLFFLAPQAKTVCTIITPARMSCVTDAVARHAPTSTLLVV